MSKTPAHTSIRLTPDLDAWLKEHAAALDRSVSWVIRQAVKEYMARQKRAGKARPHGADDAGS